MSYSYTVPADTFKAATKEEANALARAYAELHAFTTRFCCPFETVYGCTGQTVAETFSVIYGTGPFTWRVTNGTLPDGISLSFLDDGRTLVVSGIPTAAGKTTVTISTTDTSTNETISNDVEFEVVGITSNSTLSDAQVGVYYSEQLIAEGGSGSYVFAVTSGSLPAGLSLSSTGLIYGIPTTAEVAAFEISLTDQAIDDAVECNNNSVLEVAYMASAANQVYHAYGIVDFATLFADTPDWVNNPLPEYSVWDGNLPTSSAVPFVYGLIGGVETFAKFPEGYGEPVVEVRAMAWDGSPANYPKPIAYWRMRICANSINYKLWEGTLVNHRTTPDGVYHQTTPQIWPPEIPGMTIPTITLQIIA